MKKALFLTLFCVSSTVFVFAQRTEDCHELYLEFYGNVTPSMLVVDDLGYFITASSDISYPRTHFLLRYDFQHNLVFKKNLGQLTYGPIMYKGANNTAILTIDNYVVYKYNAGGTLVYTINRTTQHDFTIFSDDPAGNLTISGAYSNAGKYYMGVSRYNANGVLSWTTNIPNTSTTYTWPRDMKVLSDGSTLIIGNTNSVQLNHAKLRNDGTIAYNLVIAPLTKYVEGTSVATASDGYYITATQTKVDNTSDGYLYKTDFNGIVTRSTKYAAAYNQTFGGVVVVPDNTNPIVFFSSQDYNGGGNRGTLAKFNSAGTVQWSYFRSNVYWNAYEIFNDNAGNSYVGDSYSIVKVSASGVFSDELTSPTYVYDHSITPAGDIYMLNYQNPGCDLTTLKICAPLTVTTNVTSKSVCPGATTDFQFVVAGNGLRYQWKKNGSNVFDDDKASGARTAKLTLRNIAAGDVGDFTCEVFDNCNKTVTSAIGKLSITAPLSITTQPVSKFVCGGTGTTLSAVATGGANIKYQWAKNGVNLNDGGNITGSKLATLNIANVSAADAATYVCSITNDCNVTITTVDATIVVAPSVQVTKQPVALAAEEGAEATFTVEGSGTGLTYQWKKNNVNIANGTKYAGATSAILTVKGITCADAGSFSCTVSGSCGAPVNSSAVALTVNSVVTITQNPVAQKICAGETMSMVVLASGTNLTYSWMKGATVLNDGGRFSGTKTAMLSITTTNATDVGSYSCVVSGGCSSTKTSTAASLELISAPSILSQSPNTSACTGETMQLSVNLSAGSYTYQWFKNNAAVTNTATVTGATAASLFIINSTAADAGTYACKVTGCGSASTVSTSIIVTVTERSTITSQPVSKSFCEGNDVTLTIAANGTSPKFQWMKGGVALVDDARISGSTTSTLTIKNSDIALHQGFYTCRVQGSCGAAITSNVVLLTGNPKPDLFLQLPEPACLQLSLFTEADLVGDNESLTGTFKVYKENTTTPLSSLQAISEAGNYEIVKTTDAGCSDAVVIPLGCVVTGIEDESSFVSLSPNPSKGTVSIRSGSAFVRYEILNSLGVKVAGGDIIHEDQQVELNNISNGYYVFVMYARSGEKTLEKLILSR